MGIKRLRVAFDIDVDVLARALASHHTAMHVQLAGNAVDGPMPDDDEQPALLAAVKKGNIQGKVMQYFVAHQGKVVVMSEIHVLFGADSHSASNAIYRLVRRGMIRRAGPAKYRVTTKGINAYG